MSAKLLSRIGRKSLLDKVMPVQEALKFFHDGQKMGWSGFTAASNPKEIPIALAAKQKETGEKMQFELFIGASASAMTEDVWAAQNMISRRWPYQTGKNIAKGINRGEIDMGDTHLGMFSQNLQYGFFTKDHDDLMWDPEEKNRHGLDISIIEVTEILPNGGLILGTAVGAAPELCNISQEVVLEVNTAYDSLRGLHDITIEEMPPFRAPLLARRADDIMGTDYVPMDPEKIVAIVECTKPDPGRELGPTDDVSRTIAGHIMDFFEHEVKFGRLPKNLLPLQSGVGSIANAVVGGMADCPFENLDVWTEVLQDTMLDLFDADKVRYATATSLCLSPTGFPRYFANRKEYEKRIKLRPQTITNHPEIIRRLGVIGMNTPVEVDLYGHANSTLVGGTMMVNGIGGSGDFLRNAYLSIMHTPSARKTRLDPTGISCIVPKVAHVDHTEHDLDIIVTEQGLCDMRGLSPRRRAVEIIKQCAHPDYMDQLLDYYEYALKSCTKRGAAHEPHVLKDVYKMHTNLSEQGSMKVASWED